MPQNTLTDRAIRNAKPRAKPYRLADGDGLYLRVSATGAKSWEYRYRHAGKQQTATLGRLNATPLAEARRKAQAARELAGKGEHLTRAKSVAKAQQAASVGNTFKAVATAWVDDAARLSAWTADHKGKVEASLRNHLSKLDSLPVTEITALICSPILRSVELRAPDIARKVHQRLRSILDNAVERGLIPANPLPAKRRGVKTAVKHFPAELLAAGVGEILRNAERANVCAGVKRAHLLCAFTAQRIGEVVPARWDEVALEAGTWSIPRERMKRKDAQRGPHVVPLPPALLEQMREWHRIDGGMGFVCPAPHAEAPITREAVEKFYNRTLELAGVHSPHSWRSVFSTWAREAGKDSDAIESQLDHAVGGQVQQAYDRADRLDIRRALVGWHESKLLAARDGAQVISLAERRA